jgi:serine/threonine protein kinase
MNDQSHIQALSQRVYPHRRAAASGASNGAAAAAGDERLIAGRYRLSGRLGSGRLGDIYEAVDAGKGDVGVERRVAIQLIDRTIASDLRSIDALERGFAALRAGSHPNIVRILDFGREDRSCFVTMELLDGASLRFVLDEVDALPLEETAPVIRAVGDALQYLHTKGLVHGNVKPQNVFITDDYAVKLLDVTPTRRPSQLPYYVEDADAATPKAPDRRDDVLGLASLAYELLSGRHPFNANSPLEAHHAGLAPVPIEHLSPRQWQALERGLALERAKRAPTIADFLREFGITGSERLRATSDESDTVTAATPPRREPGPDAVRDTREHRASERPTPPATAPATRPASAPPARPLPPPAEASDPDAWQRPRPAARPGPRVSLRLPLLLAVAAGLGGLAFVEFERLRDGATALIAAIDMRLNPGPADASSVAVVTPPPAAPAAAGAPDRTAGEPRESVTGTVAPGSVVEQTPGIRTEAETAGADSIETAANEAEIAADRSSAASAPNAAEAVAPAPVGAPAAVEHTPVSAGEAPAPAAEPRTAAAAPPTNRADTPPAEPRFRFTASVVTVSESEPAAALVVERSGDLSGPTSIVWWSSGDTARAGEDYADLGQTTERFAAGEQRRTLLIPLIDDAVPESRESFYVYLGRFDPVRNHLEPLSTVRVDIVDDD